MPLASATASSEAAEVEKGSRVPPSPVDDVHEICLRQDRLLLTLRGDDAGANRLLAGDRGPAIRRQSGHVVQELSDP